MLAQVARPDVILDKLHREIILVCEEEMQHFCHSC